jgi:hypothetical protein
LPLEGLLRFVEQTDVLYCDDCLVGEGLKERYLVVRKPAGLASGHCDRPECLVVTEQRHRYPAPVATGPSAGAHNIGHSGIGMGVGDIERHAIANGLGVNPIRLERPWKCRSHRRVARFVGAGVRYEFELIARKPYQPT